jgi:mono/diheme cytochrome c family protein
MLKPFLLLSAASLFVLSPALVRAGGSQDAAAQAPAASHAGASNPVKPTPETQAKAKNLYAIDCAMCHGDNGNGQTDLTKSMSLNMVDFADGKAMSAKTDGDLFDIIRNGKDKMPPEAEGRASDTMVWNLIIYIRKMASSTAATAQ